MDAKTTPPPTISIIVNAYNRTSYVNRALKSIANQTLDPSHFETIIVTNVPVDSGLVRAINGKVIPFAESRPGLRVSKALEATSGSVVTLLDDDDTWDPEKLKQVFDIVVSNPKVSYVHNQWIPVGEDDERIEHPMHAHARRKMAQLGTLKLYPESATYRNVRQWATLLLDFNSSCITVRRDTLVRKLAYLRSLDGLGVDAFCFYAALVEKGSVLVAVPSVLTRYRIHLANSTIRLPEKSGDARTEDYNAIIQMLQEEWPDSPSVRSVRSLKSYMAIADGCVRGRLNRLALLSRLARHLRFVSLSDLGQNCTLLLFGAFCVIFPRLGRRVYESQYNRV